MFKVKVISLFLVGSFLALSAGYFFSNFAIYSNYWALLITIILIVFYLSFFLVRVLLIEKWQISLIAIVIEMLAMSLFFFNYLSLWTLMALIVAVFLLFVSYTRGRSEINNVLKVHFRNLQYTVLSTALLGLALYGIITYISLINLDNLAIEKEPVSYAIKINENIVGKFLPGFSTQIKFGDLLEMIVQKTNKQLPPEITKMLVFDVNRKISRSIGANIKPEENIVDAVQKIINHLLNKIPSQFRILVIIGLGLVIFFVINGGTFFFVWMIGFISWLIYKLLLTTKFAHINLEKSQRETISL